VQQALRAAAQQLVAERSVAACSRSRQVVAERSASASAQPGQASCSPLDAQRVAAAIQRRTVAQSHPRALPPLRLQCLTS
jgi:hypothetical protein